MAAPKAPSSTVGKSQEPHARGGRLRHRAEAAPRARDRARRAQRGPRRHARRRRAAASSRAAARSRGARRAPAAPAQARSARRTGPAAGSPSRRRCAASSRRSTARPAAPRCAAPSRAHAQAGTLGVLDPTAFDAPSTKAAPSSSAPGARSAAAVVAQPEEEALIKSFRNLARVAITVPTELEVAAPRLGALAARHRAARSSTCRGGRMSLHPNEVLLAPVVSEKSYALIDDRKYCSRSTGRAQDADPPGGRGALRRPRDRASTFSRCSRSRSGAGWSRAAARLEEGDRPAARGRVDRDLRGGPGLDASPQVQADLPGPPLHVGLDLRGDHEDRAREEPDRAAEEERRPERRTAASPRRHQGGGHKRRTGSIDFKRLKDGVPAKVAAIEYDPNRSARIALLHYADGAKAYILAPARLQVGALVESGPGADIKPGNALPLAEHPDRHARPQRRAQAGPGRAAGAQRRLGRPARGEGRGTGRRFGSHRASCAGSRSRAGRRSARSATSTTRTSPAARRAAAAGGASARRCAALR